MEGKTKIHEKTRTLSCYATTRNYTKSALYLCVLVFSFAWFGILKVQSAEAANLYFSPSSGTYKVGQTFSVSVFVSSADQAMNAASGIVTFPADKLEATSLSKSGSIFTLWVLEPTLNGSTGRATFEGVVVNPGYTGSAGKIVTVNFKVKEAGEAAVRFASGTVLANDGQGTNILASLGSALFALELPVTGPAAPEATTPSITPGVPAAPRVSSKTHPDPNQWYANNDPTFEWSSPAGVTGVNVLADQEPNTNPGTRSDGVFSSHSYEDVDEGSWYFHIRLRNALGWGGISHFQFQIDTKNPEKFEIKEIPRDDPTNPRARFLFEAQDATSGIDHFEVQINNGTPEIWRDDGTHTYATAALGPGKHNLLVKAFDKAGNYLTDSAEFEIAPLEPPEITEYPKELRPRDILEIKGKTYPDATVTLWVQKENETPQSQQTRSGRDGAFEVVYDERLEEGIYKIWADVRNELGAISEPSRQLTVIVRPPPLLKIGSFAINVLAVVVPLLGLLLLLLLLLLHAWRKFVALRKRLRKEVREAEVSLHRAFDSLRADIVKQIKLLEKVKTARELTQEEEKVIKQLKRDLAKAEALVEKEIEDIEKQVK